MPEQTGVENTMKVLLGVTGSVAATLTDKMIETLEEDGHQVKVVVTRPATYFWRRGRWAYIWSALRSKLFRDPLRWCDKILTDWDEWQGWSYHKNDPVLHIVLRDWADVLIIAPLTASTLAKLANGVSDNLLTCVARAWLPTKPMILAPAMNTQMWAHPVTMEHLTTLQFHDKWAHRPSAIIVQPQEKKLACGDTGMGAMAKIECIAKAVKDTQG